MRAITSPLLIATLLILSACDGGVTQASLQAEQAKQAQQQMTQLKQQIDAANAVGEQRLKDLEGATQ
ncbi:hypothetical protein [Pseudomonas sp. Marseille-Q8238]